jgi:hypothetical protein
MPLPVDKTEADRFKTEMECTLLGDRCVPGEKSGPTRPGFIRWSTREGFTVGVGTEGLPP